MKIFRTFISYFYFYFSILNASNNESIRTKFDIIKEIINNHNNSYFPSQKNTRLKIHVELDISEIKFISEVDMEFSMTCYIRQTWKDDRLGYKDYNESITLKYNEIGYLWTPDTFIWNLRSGKLHEITFPNKIMRLTPDGSVFFSQRFNLVLVCNMELDRFPLDNQTCFIELGSYAHTLDDLIYLWKDPSEMIINDSSSLSGSHVYSVTGSSLTSCEKIYYTYSYSCLRAEFYFSRRFEAYILCTYLPSLLVVLLSWLSFWIDPESTPARTSLSILTILTITTQSSSLVKTAGSFTRASDIWIATCLVFVFAAFIEYSIVDSLQRKSKREHLETKDSQIKSIDVIYKESCCIEVNNEKSTSPAMAVEKASRILFPALFFLFNLIYWSYYLSGYTQY